MDVRGWGLGSAFDWKAGSGNVDLSQVLHAIIVHSKRFQCPRLDTWRSMTGLNSESLSRSHYHSKLDKFMKVMMEALRESNYPFLSSLTSSPSNHVRVNTSSLVAAVFRSPRRALGSRGGSRFTVWRCRGSLASRKGLWFSTSCLAWGVIKGLLGGSFDSGLSP